MVPKVGKALFRRSHRRVRRSSIPGFAGEAARTKMKNNTGRTRGSLIPGFLFYVKSQFSLFNYSHVCVLVAAFVHLDPANLGLESRVILFAMKPSD